MVDAASHFQKATTKAGKPLVTCSVCARPYLSRHAMLAHSRRDHPTHDGRWTAELAALARKAPLTGRVLLLPVDATLDLQTVFSDANVVTCNYHSRAARYSLNLRRPDAFAHLLRCVRPDVVVCMRDKRLGLRMLRAKKAARYMLLKREEAVRLKCDATYPLEQRDDVVWAFWRVGS